MHKPWLIEWQPRTGVSESVFLPLVFDAVFGVSKLTSLIETMKTPARTASSSAIAEAHREELYNAPHGQSCT